MGKLNYVSAFLLASAAFAADPASAAPGGPSIAYALESGSTQSIYLQNQDGSGKVKVYTGGNKVRIVQIDVRPGGNQLALIETSVSGGQGVLKMINYSDAGVAQQAFTIAEPGCTAQGVDYHPSDGSMLVSRYCNSAEIQEVRRFANGAWDADGLFGVTNGNPSKAAGFVRWLGDGSGFLWAAADTTTGGGIQRHNLSNPSAPRRIYSTGSLSLPSWFDVAHCLGPLDASCSKLLVTDQAGQIHSVTFDDFGWADRGILYSSASDGHYAPDNSQVLWRQQVKSSYQLKIDNQNFGAKGTYTAKDWRQYKPS